jgi:hypothetical protein
VTLATVLSRVGDNTIRGGVRTVLDTRLTAAIGRDDIAEARRALADMEGTVFEGEGTAIGTPVTHPAKPTL